MKKLYVTIEVWQKGNLYLASSPELDFISQGNTFEEAKKNLLEVIKIQFEEMTELGTLKDYLEECGYEKKDNFFVANNEMVAMEKHSLQVA